MEQEHQRLCGKKIEDNKRTGIAIFQDKNLRRGIVKNLSVRTLKKQEQLEVLKAEELEERNRM